MAPKPKKQGRPKKRPESKYFPGKIWIRIPFPVRDDEHHLVGYRWKKTDLISLLKEIPAGYSPFTEAEGYIFDSDEAEIIVHFIINECVFPEGELTGRPFVPEKWQWAIYLNTYGWFEEKNPKVRRFNEVFILTPRKNGKTTAFGAIPSLIALFVDPEQRSQNFCCAADVEQAALNFRHASYMVEQNKKLLNRLTGGKIRYGSRYMEHNNGRTMKVLSSVAETKHGLSPNYVGVDEVHAHSNSELIDVMVTGTASRLNPLVMYTTTADYNRPSICNELYKRAKSICDGLQSDPSFLPIIYEAQPTDDWESPKIWKKSNPNFGISVNEKYFKKTIRQVKNSPKLLNRFLRLHLNIRTAVETSWIFPHIWGATNPVFPTSELLTPEDIRVEMENRSSWFSVVDTEVWASTSVDIHLSHHAQYFTWFFNKLTELQDSPCFAAYDNAAVSDIASLALFFPNTKDLLSFNWVPSESIEQRSQQEHIPYQNWFNCGLINNSPQSSIDEDHIVEALVGKEGILHHFDDVRVVAFDAWGSTNISNNVTDAGHICRRYPQSYAGMNQPCKTMESWLLQEQLHHGGHPVLAWKIGNTMLTQDNNDRVRPSRKDSTDKIDGIVSSLMAIGAWMYDEDTLIDTLAGLESKEN